MFWISRVTSCEECEGKNRIGVWARHLQRDSDNSNIVYKNVTIRVMGLPIAYIPYLECQIQVLIEHEAF